MTVEAISSSHDNNRTSLQAWAAYSARVTVKLKSDADRMAGTPTRQVTLESQAAGPRTESLHASCAYDACAQGGLGSSGALMGKATIVQVKLNGELSPEEKRLLEELRRRDAQVRRHEQAHLAAAGRWALGPPRYTYQIGPDGQRYAIGGEVRIDLSPVPGDPETTLRKARQIQQAALAPIDPSAADRQVAMQAAEMAQEALRQIQQERLERMRSQREKVQEPQGEEEPGPEIAPASEDPSTVPETHAGVDGPSEPEEVTSGELIGTAFPRGEQALRQEPHTPRPATSPQNLSSVDVYI